ncbi:MAG: tyrosinase family protein [Chitinophagales bacterium]|nr:tyrosinase family protein [Chitinophagales bacterium]MDW8427614.1 tyrosinase family protein [Chitinophagales bacterium]
MLMGTWLAVSKVLAQPDLYIVDHAGDTGTEPSSPQDTFSSPAIWVLQDPDPNWQPYPFEGSVPWQVPTMQPPKHYDWRLFNRPSWIYVLISNRGNQPSSGSERLRLYWTASTDLHWPTCWNDYLLVTDDGGEIILLGEEITKPRCNAALLSDSQRMALIEAWLRLDSLFYPDSVSLWDKQDQIHRVTHVHNTPNFLPWHRELIMRFELLLRSVNPTLRLPYWDWTTDPRNSSGFNFFSPTFMGSDQGRCGPPFDHFDANYDCTKARASLDFSCLNNLFCADQPDDYRRPNYVIERAVAAGAPDSIDADSLIVASCLAAPVGDQYLWFWGGYLKNLNYSLEQNHRLAHTHLGKTLKCKHTAFQDPFAYLLHSNVDKLWALWQRQPSATHRLDASAIYGNISNNMYLHEFMHPWDGGSAISNPIAPWLPGSEAIQKKNAFDVSVVIPVTYDVVPLTIPVLQPGQSVVVAYPWHVPELTVLPSPHPDTLYLFLLARIETDSSPNYGMTVAETSVVKHNIVHNNNIAGRRIAVPRITTQESSAIPMKAFWAYPNPASGQVTVHPPDNQPYVMRLLLPDGRTVRQQWMQGTTTFNVADLQPGLYLILLDRADRSQQQIFRLVIH